MQIKVDTVDEYIKLIPEDRQNAITRLRNLCLEIMPSYEESMEYGMPTYKSGKSYFAFASQKQYISVYVQDHEKVVAYEDKLGKMNHGKSCIRYRKEENINWEGLKALLEDVY